MSEIDGVTLTYCFANRASLLTEITAAIIYIGDKGNCLSEVYVDGFVLRYLLIEWIRVADRAVFYTGSTSRAFALIDVPGLFGQRYTEVPCFTLYPVNFSKREDFYVYVPVDLDQFGGKYSHRAVVGRKGLVQLGHMAAKGRPFFDKENFETGFGEIERGLNAADPSTNDHDVAKIVVSKGFPSLPHNSFLIVSKTLTNLLYDLFFFDEFFCHFFYHPTGYCVTLMRRGGHGTAVPLRRVSCPRTTRVNHT